MPSNALALMNFMLLIASVSFLILWEASSFAFFWNLLKILTKIKRIMLSTKSTTQLINPSQLATKKMHIIVKRKLYI